MVLFQLFVCLFQSSSYSARILMVNVEKLLTFPRCAKSIGENLQPTNLKKCLSSRNGILLATSLARPVFVLNFRASILQILFRLVWDSLRLPLRVHAVLVKVLDRSLIWDRRYLSETILLETLLPIERRSSWQVQPLGLTRTLSR